MQRLRPSALSVLMLVLSILWLLLLALSLESASAEAPDLRWQRSTLFPALGEVSALAFDPDTGRVAVGDEQGVWLSGGAPAAARVLRRGPVRDLAFGPGGGLYAATDRGLFHQSGDGKVTERSLGAGARAVRRILVTPELVLAATAGVALDQGRPAEAEPLVRQALAIGREVGSRELLAWSFSLL